MVNIIKRMRKLREQLLWIRVGPGALILPKEVQKIALEFNKEINGGHRGARKFWREMLPRIKYRNPAIPIQITRHNDREGPAKMYIYTSTPDSSSHSTTTTPSTISTIPTEPTHTIDIKMLPESRILSELISATNAQVIEPTEEELEQMKEIEEFKTKAQADRELVREKFLRARKEEELLRLARGEVDGA
ncbi:hypothetical protein GQ43DRAFT_392900 [Delitschia confertaspora ATCC 74209]|uniref:Ribosomal protein/NADH dehydrogenase domain-containing protein n=1 Tax=Delitschia confertaspora ATCC 74209 TaxID=1513339 RepID=A0A9P4MT23_9PLEO|nr:hypothetical protein GQ43DRAFT_392900 [Delitschia confertaspora ATCC 74209]